MLASNGKHIRWASKVETPSGTVIRFINKMSKREAIRQAQIQEAR